MPGAAAFAAQSGSLEIEPIVEITVLRSTHWVEAKAKPQ